MKKYLFIDRDGTLVAEPADEQVDRLDKIEFEPDVIASMQRLRDAGWSFVMVTNQDGLGTDSFPEEDFRIPQDFIVGLLRSQGIVFDEILVCPHFPSDNCKCRKPNVGLVLEYLKRTDWDRENSRVIGDRETDVKLGENMGIGSIKYNRESMGWTAIADSLTKQPRTAKIVRDTKETKISVEVNLDKEGGSSIATGIGFFDHMLDQIATHGGFRMDVSCEGDLHVDEHHSVEDVGIALGTAIRQALGDKRGIIRFAYVLPMDEVYAKLEAFETSLLNEKISVALDISGRPFCSFVCDADWTRQNVGDFPTEMVPHFFRSLADAMGITLHLNVTEGNAHHQVEALFKGFGRALRTALRKEGNALPSSKGVL